MKDLTKKELALASKMLELASEKFGNHGCNDVDNDVYKGWTTEERQDFVKQFHEWNGDPEEYNETHLRLPDFCLMDILAAKLKHQSEH